MCSKKSFHDTEIKMKEFLDTIPDEIFDEFLNGVYEQISEYDCESLFKIKTAV